jgi:hypothetical protein
MPTVSPERTAKSEGNAGWHRTAWWAWQDSNLQPDRYGATRPRSGSSRPSRARRGGKIALSIPAPEGERFIA